MLNKSSTLETCSIKKGNNSLIDDRVGRGIQCIRSTVAECGALTLGQYAIQSLLLMYKTMLVQTVIFNSETWCNLNKENENKLKVVQMKYLKRIMHTPQSTSNVAIQIELGVKPILNEIHSRQLKFLHHILNLEEEDPVKMVYNEQKKFHFEKNMAPRSE